MSSPAEAAPPALRPSNPVGDWHRYGAKLHEVSLSELLQFYEAGGFLYPAKRERLSPYLSEVTNAWTRMLQAGGDLRRVYAWQHGNRWASLDLWQSAPGVWTVQHLVANGGGAGARSTILAALVHGLDDQDNHAWESWFRPSNPFPEAVLGGSVGRLGECGARADHAYIAVPVSRLQAPKGPASGAGLVEVVESGDAPADLLTLARSSRHHAFAASIGLDTDPLLEDLDRRFRSVGLRRYRRIFLARDEDGRLHGAALAHRGPLALNFSLLENRCDLLLADTKARSNVAQALLAAAAVAYTDFRPDVMPTMIAIDGGRDRTAQAHDWADALDGSLIQVYAQVVWLRPGLPALADYFQHRIHSRS